MKDYQIVTISEFENALVNKDYDTSVALLIKLCAELENKVGFSTRSALDHQNPDIISIYTRYAAGINSLLLDNHYIIRDEDYFRLCIYGRNLSAIYLASGFDNSGALIDILQKQLQQHCKDPNTLSDKAKQVIKRLMLAYSFYCPQDINFQVFLRVCPTLSLTPFLALFSTQVLLSEQAFFKRENLFNQAALLPSLHEKQIPFTLIAALWMLCSYGWRRDKHQFKSYVNHLIINWLSANEVSIPTVPKRTLPVNKSKPKLLLNIEIMTSKHAMFRCYSRALTALRERFYLVSVSADGWLDSPAQALFDENLTYPPEKWNAHHDHHSIQAIIDLIHKQHPDIIYYPSVGMNSVCIALANCRLAPIQVASLGHPATTCSAHIDYMLAPEEIYTEKANDLFTEKLLLFPMKNFEMLPGIESTQLKAKVRTNPDVINLVITQVSYKLNPIFLKICHEIKTQSKRPIQFHFFPNEVNVTYECVKKEIFQILPGAKVYSTCPLTEYLNLLGQGDIALATFPFGSTNGATDVACLGIPLVTLVGDEFHSRYDAHLLQELGMPDWLCQQDTDGYSKAVLRLIDNDAERVELSHTFADRMQALIERKQRDNIEQQDFLQLFWGLYHKHESFMQSNDKAFPFASITENLPT